jgi:hypothetical protein
VQGGVEYEGVGTAGLVAGLKVGEGLPLQSNHGQSQNQESLHPQDISLLNYDPQKINKNKYVLFAPSLQFSPFPSALCPAPPPPSPTQIRNALAN